MIFISNGIPKSASSFSFLLCNEVAHVKAPRQLICRALPKELQPVYFKDINDHIDELVARVPQDRVYVIKTHSNLNNKIRQYIEDGKVLASFAYRDPYDTVMSLVDAGKREREITDPAKRRPGFVNILTIEDALGRIPNMLKNGRTWLEQVDNLPGLVRTPYETLKKFPEWVVEDYARMIGVKVNARAIVNKFLDNKQLIWEYNKGISGRGRSKLQLADNDPVKILMDEFNADFPQP